MVACDEWPKQPIRFKKKRYSLVHFHVLRPDELGAKQSR